MWKQAKVFNSQLNISGAKCFLFCFFRGGGVLYGTTKQACHVWAEFSLLDIGDN